MEEEQTKDKEIILKEKMNKVIEALSRKADEGDAESCCRLANIYIACSENVKDYIKAYKLACKAYKSGNVESAFLLGEMNQFGTGCEKNPVRAKYYYYKLLRLSDLDERLGKSTIKDLYTNLGKLYMNGRHKFLNSYRARKYFQKAVEMGDEESSLYLEDIEEHIGEYKRDFIGRTVFCLFAVIVCIWAFRTIREKCLPLYQHIYDSVITDAVRVSDGEQGIVADTVANVNSEEQSQTLDEAGDKGYTIVSAVEFEKMDYISVIVKEATATSEVINDVGLNYPVNNTTDGKKYTCWQENENDDGIGQSLSYAFSKEENIYAVSFYNGNARNEKAFSSHNRICDIQIQNKQTVKLQDSMEEQFVVFDEPLKTDQIKITINSIFAGDGNHDTCLSEIQFFTK